MELLKRTTSCTTCSSSSRSRGCFAGGLPHSHVPTYAESFLQPQEVSSNWQLGLRGDVVPRLQTNGQPKNPSKTRGGGEKVGPYDQTPRNSSIPPGELQDAARTASTDSVRVRFNVPGYVTAFGQVIKAVGCPQALGGWDPHLAPELTWRPGHEWWLDVTLPVGTFEFKLVLYDTQTCSVVSWEEGVNRLVELPSSCAGPQNLVDVTCCWSSTSHTQMVPRLDKQYLEDQVSLLEARIHFLQRRKTELEARLALLGRRVELYDEHMNTVETSMMFHLKSRQLDCPAKEEEEEEEAIPLLMTSSRKQYLDEEEADSLVVSTLGTCSGPRWLDLPGWSDQECGSSRVVGHGGVQGEYGASGISGIQAGVHEGALLDSPKDDVRELGGGVPGDMRETPEQGGAFLDGTGEGTGGSLHTRSSKGLRVGVSRQREHRPRAPRRSRGRSCFRISAAPGDTDSTTPLISQHPDASGTPYVVADTVVGTLGGPSAEQIETEDDQYKVHRPSLIPEEPHSSQPIAIHAVDSTTSAQWAANVVPTSVQPGLVGDLLDPGLYADAMPVVGLVEQDHQDIEMLEVAVAAPPPTTCQVDVCDEVSALLSVAASPELPELLRDLESGLSGAGDICDQVDLLLRRFNYEQPAMGGVDEQSAARDWQVPGSKGSGNSCSAEPPGYDMIVGPSDVGNQPCSPAASKQHEWDAGELPAWHSGSLRTRGESADGDCCPLAEVLCQMSVEEDGSRWGCDVTREPQVFSNDTEHTGISGGLKGRFGQEESLSEGPASVGWSCMREGVAASSYCIDTGIPADMEGWTYERLVGDMALEEELVSHVSRGSSCQVDDVNSGNSGYSGYKGSSAVPPVTGKTYEEVVASLPKRWLSTVDSGGVRQHGGTQQHLHTYAIGADHQVPLQSVGREEHVLAVNPLAKQVGGGKCDSASQSDTADAILPRSDLEPVAASGGLPSSFLRSQDAPAVPSRDEHHKIEEERPVACERAAVGSSRGWLGNLVDSVSARAHSDTELARKMWQDTLEKTRNKAKEDVGKLRDMLNVMNKPQPKNKPCDGDEGNGQTETLLLESSNLSPGHPFPGVVPQDFGEVPSSLDAQTEGGETGTSATTRRGPPGLSVAAGRSPTVLPGLQVLPQDMKAVCSEEVGMNPGQECSESGGIVCPSVRVNKASQDTSGSGVDERANSLWQGALVQARQGQAGASSLVRAAHSAATEGWHEARQGGERDLRLLGLGLRLTVRSSSRIALAVENGLGRANGMVSGLIEGHKSNRSHNTSCRPGSTPVVAAASGKSSGHTEVAQQARVHNGEVVAGRNKSLGAVSDCLSASTSDATWKRSTSSSTGNWGGGFGHVHDRYYDFFEATHDMEPNRARAIEQAMKKVEGTAEDVPEQHHVGDIPHQQAPVHVDGADPRDVLRSPSLPALLLLLALSEPSKLCWQTTQQQVGQYLGQLPGQHLVSAASTLLGVTSLIMMNVCS